MKAPPSAENPILLLSGDSPVTQDGKGAFQEFDQISVSAPLTKFAKRVMAAEDLGQDTIQAIRTALAGRPGPVHLALPFDVLNNDAGDATAPDAAAFQPSTVAPKADVISTIIDALEGAERPLILVGPSQNASRAGSPHTQLADALDTPVIPMESPRGLNDPSLGNLAAAIANADVIVSLGKDIDFTTGFGKAPKISAECAFYMIDPDPKFLNRAEAAMGSRMKLQACADTRVARDMLVEAGAAGLTPPGVMRSRRSWLRARHCRKMRQRHRCIQRCFAAPFKKFWMAPMIRS